MNQGVFVGPCYTCKSQMWLPQSLYDAGQHSEQITFYCPYGHPQVFLKGDTEADKLRRENQRLVQQQAQLYDEIHTQKKLVDSLKEQHKVLEGAAKTAKSAARKARVRASAGLCPCCNRSFAAVRMAQHIKTKHPEFKAEAVA